MTYKQKFNVGDIVVLNDSITEDHPTLGHIRKQFSRLQVVSYITPGVVRVSGVTAHVNLFKGTGTIAEEDVADVLLDLVDTRDTVLNVVGPFTYHELSATTFGVIDQRTGEVVFKDIPSLDEAAKQTKIKNEEFKKYSYQDTFSEIILPPGSYVIGDPVYLISDVPVEANKRSDWYNFIHSVFIADTHNRIGKGVYSSGEYKATAFGVRYGEGIYNSVIKEGSQPIRRANKFYSVISGRIGAVSTWLITSKKVRIVHDQVIDSTTNEIVGHEIYTTTPLVCKTTCNGSVVTFEYDDKLVIINN